jgi:hypothetical protein
MMEKTMHTEFWWRNLLERNMQLEAREEYNGRITLRWIIER